MAHTAASAPEGSSPVDASPPLKRVIGPGLLLLFIVGDILGAGVYAVTGQMAAQVGGVAWLPFILAFAVATLTAFSYLELVTKYPRAAGAALYTHKAFGIHFVTFLVAFAVICSGITSASTSSNLLAKNLLIGLDGSFGSEGLGWFGVPTGSGAALTVALLFMILLALINLRGVGESVKFNVILTLVEMAALCIVIVIGFVAIGQGGADISRITVFTDEGEKGMFLAVTIATTIAFFAMVGFEDSVNMVEETKNPERIFPKIMLTGLGIACFIYVLVAVAVVAVLPPGELGDPGEEGVLLDVVRKGAPGLPIADLFPYLTVFAVANTALINMLMASRLLYGLSRQGVIPKQLGKVSRTRQSPWAAVAFTTVLALILISVVATLSTSSVVGALSGTTGLLLLCVFAVVNVACLILKRREDKVFFRVPVWVPVLGAVTCLFLAGPWARTSTQMIQYKIAAALIGIGIVLWVITYFVNKSAGTSSGEFTDIDHLGDESDATVDTTKH